MYCEKCDVTINETNFCFLCVATETSVTSNGLLCGLNLRAETPRELLPIFTKLNKLMNEGDLAGIDDFFRDLMQEETSTLVQIGVLRVTLCMRNELSAWEPARDFFAETMPDAKALMRGLYAT